jgi:hypothetical protein
MGFLFCVVSVLLVVLFLHFFYITPYVIKPSAIHGVGIHTQKNILKNEVLFKAISEDKSVTHLGSYVNHCNRPNTKLVEKENSWFLVALVDIPVGTELKCNYNLTPDFIMKPNENWTC